MSPHPLQHLAGIEKLLDDPHPTPGTRYLALGLGAVATSRFAAAEEAFEQALDHGVAPETMIEIAASAHLLAGFPRAINGLEACHRAIRRARVDRPINANGSGPPRAPASSPTVSRERGRALFDAIYGDRAGELLDRLGTLAPRFDEWILEHAYGQVLARDGAPARLRELTVAGALVLLDVPRQLQSHVRGSLRLGATAREVVGVVRTMDILASDCQATRAREILALEGLSPPPPAVQGQPADRPR